MSYLTLIDSQKAIENAMNDLDLLEGNREQDELVKISFMAYNYKIEFVVMTYNSGLTITYDNNTEQGIIYTANFYFGYDSGIEQKLNEWKDTL